MENNITINNRIPQLRFPGYTGDWEEKSLGEVGVFVRGLSYNKGEVTQDRAATLVLRSNNIIQDGVVDCRNGLQFVTKEPSSEQILQKGDIVICLSNGSSNLVGKSANYEGDYAGIATVGAFCGIYRSTAPITKYLVQTPAYKKSVELIKQGGNGALANLYGRDILGLKFYFPTLEEQNEIVECLEAEDRMITAQEQKVESLKTHKKGLMQQLFPQPGATTPVLRFPGFTGEWQEKPLSHFLHEHKTKSDGKCEVHSVSVAKGVINQVEYLGRSFAASDTSKYNLAKPGDIIYTKSPTGAFPYGIVKQNKNPYNVIVSPLYAVYTPVNQYVGYILDSYFESSVNTNNYLSSLIQKGAKNTIQISNDTFVSKSMCLPSDPAEQQKIAECLETLDNLIAAESKKLESLKTHKKGLMQQLFPQPVK
uniref:restriction endonuclease subunit S n=1 Tax=Candidatus Cryptobacteroides bacterium TaxID=3085639 RepID=UPI004029D962